MPITIKELHIKIHVDEKQSASSSAPPKVDSASIVATCVEEVMTLLERQRER